MSQDESKIRQFWHDQFSPFNPGRDFVVLFGDCGGKHALLLMQLDDGSPIKTGDILPTTAEGIPIDIYVKTSSKGQLTKITKVMSGI